MSVRISHISLCTFFILALPLRLNAQNEGCDSVDIYFINGMGNTERTAETSTKMLRNKLRLDSRFRECIDNGSIEVYLAHNDYKDAWENASDVIQQSYRDFILSIALTQEQYNSIGNHTKNIDINDEDMARHISSYIESIENERKVVLVAHSQGNYYANGAYDLLENIGFIDYRDYVGIVSVGTPAGRVADGSQHITNTLDLIIQAVDRLFAATLDPNVTNFPLGDTGHEFVKNYLFGSETGDQICDAVFNRIRSLKSPSEDTPDPPPSPPCNSCGDVHVRTPDGLAYDFQGAGEYLLMASEDGTIIVQARQEPWGSSDRVSVNTATAMNVSGDRVGVYLGRSPNLYINGTPTFVSTETLELPNGGVVYSSGGGSPSEFLVEWPSGFLVSVKHRHSFLDIGMSKPEELQGTFSGLLGNLNGMAGDDVSTRSGERLAFPLAFETLYRMFGHSWRINQTESLFDYEPGTSTETYALLDFPHIHITADDLDPAAYEAARQVCEAVGITDPRLLEDCILDVGITGENEFAESATFSAQPEEEVAIEFPDGLEGSYYDGYFNDDLSFFDQNTPLLQRIDSTIHFTDIQASWNLDEIPALADLETFSVRWQGKLLVPATGMYTLYLSSDDASYLFLDEASISPSLANATINNGGPHVVREEETETHLTAGEHNILVLYGENTVNNVVRLSWSSNQLGIEKQTISSFRR